MHESLSINEQNDYLQILKNIKPTLYQQSRFVKGWMKLTEEKRTRRFYWILVAAALLSILTTWLILTLTQPVLTDPAISIWTAVQTPAEYRDKININTATVDELTYAEGIGPSTAKNIYDYLRQKGPVDSIDDLDNIPGIGEKRLEALKKIFYAG